MKAIEHLRENKKFYEINTLSIHGHEYFVLNEETIVSIMEDYVKTRDQAIKMPFCDQCGQFLTLVRPGKWQCDNKDCSTNKT